MKKQAFTAALLSALLLTAVAVAFTVDSATAAYEYDPEIAVSSPTEGKTYTVNSVKLQFAVHINLTIGVTDLEYYQINYYLDGKALGAPLEQSVSGDITMKVANGEHTVKILARAKYVSYIYMPGPWWYSSEVVVRFAVDTGVGPGVSVSGLEEYKTNEVTLHIIIDVPDVKVTYSLDGQRSVSVPNSELVKYYGGYLCSVAFANMTDGVHSLTAYATDALGYTVVAEKTFTVRTAASQPEPNGSEPEPSDLEPEPEPPFTAILLAVTVAILPIAIVIIGLLVYFKKRQKMKT